MMDPQFTDFFFAQVNAAETYVLQANEKVRMKGNRYLYFA